MANERRFQQTIINMTGSQDMRVGGIKVDLKQDSETYTATNDPDPYAVAFGARTYEIQLSEVDPLHINYFKNLFNHQKALKNLSALPSLFIYGYNRKGETTRIHGFANCYIEELSFENNEPFDVKLTALTRST